MQDWDALYRIGDTPWELGGPSPPLVDLVHAHRARLGRVLVPGCGRGDDALYVATLGADVSGWDPAPSAIAAARATAQGHRLSVAFDRRDALIPAPDTTDLFDTWIEHTFYCALPPDRRPRYAESAASWLRPGGLILGVFMIGDRAKGPPYGTTEEEVWDVFAAHFHLVSLIPTTNSPGMWAGREIAAVWERRAPTTAR